MKEPFVIKRNSWHFKLVDVFFTFENKVSLCKYFWCVVGSIVIVPLIIGIMLAAIMAWTVIATILLIGYPRPSKLDAENINPIEFYPAYRGWFCPWFIPIASFVLYCDISFFTTWRHVAFTKDSPIIAVIATIIACFSAAVFLTVIAFGIYHLFKRFPLFKKSTPFRGSDTARLIREFIKAKKDRVCPILQIEPEPETNQETVTA